MPKSAHIHGYPCTSDRRAFPNGSAQTALRWGTKRTVVPLHTRGVAGSKPAAPIYYAVYLAVAVENDVAVATGESTCTKEVDGTVEEVFFDCFVMRFDPAGLCCEFIEQPRT